MTGHVTTLTVAQLAREREQAADDLDTAIVALGVAYASYQRTTEALSARVGIDLTYRVEPVLILHLAQAGFGPFLERKLQGAAAALRALVEDEHRKLIEGTHA